MHCLVVDDDMFARAGIKAVLQQRDGDIVCSEAVSGEEALAMLRADPQRFDMIFLDLHLAAGLSGGDLLKTLKGELACETPVVVISGDDDVRTVKELFRNGAASYLLKSGSRDDEFFLAIGEVLARKTHIPSRISSALMAEDEASSADVKVIVARLSEQQRVLLTLLTHGLANKTIGARLNLGERRVKELITDLFTLFGVRTRALLLVKLSQHYALPYRFSDLNVQSSAALESDKAAGARKGRFSAP